MVQNLLGSLTRVCKHSTVVPLTQGKELAMGQFHKKNKAL